MRVYRAYSNGVQFHTLAVSTYCRSIIMQGALAMIILNYINILLFIVVFTLVLVNKQRKQKEKQRANVELASTGH